MAGFLNDIGNNLGLSAGLGFGGGREEPTETATSSALPTGTRSADATSISASSVATSIPVIDKRSAFINGNFDQAPETFATPSPNTTFLVGGQLSSQTTFVTSTLSSSSLTESIATSLGLSSSTPSLPSSASPLTPTPDATTTRIVIPTSPAATTPAAVANGNDNQIIQDQTSGSNSSSGLPVAAIAGIAGGVGGLVVLVSILFVLHRVWRKRRNGGDEPAGGLDQMYDTGRAEGFSSTDKLVRWNKGLSEYHRPDASQAYKAYRM
ncbi:hypothetical protein NUW58_g3279 [Xylaria curta]|uniref:Uncharacterized protein n=1 Tax=Xylaria curta TaxID=42375 RepID=A0ACC1PD79_9PEZI|nr:hypothetical protein NUW58_g3279 [Xylaria curta]